LRDFTILSTANRTLTTQTINHQRQSSRKNYDVKVTYVKGTEVPIADALSRISQTPATDNGQLPQLDIHYLAKTLPASQAKLQQISDETTNDHILNTLRETIYRGWPDKREKCPEALHDYWNFRKEITIEDGLTLNGDRIVVPPTLRQEISTSSNKDTWAKRDAC